MENLGYRHRDPASRILDLDCGSLWRPVAASCGQASRLLDGFIRRIFTGAYTGIIACIFNQFNVDLTYSNVV
jgi:hypothetical protein